MDVVKDEAERVPVTSAVGALVDTLVRLGARVLVPPQHSAQDRHIERCLEAAPQSIHSPRRSIPDVASPCTWKPVGWIR